MFHVRRHLASGAMPGRRVKGTEWSAMDTTFRANVGAVIADPSGRVLVLERADISGSWQFPQGGIAAGEEPLDAVYREVFEETGIDPADLEHIATHPEWLAYELPKEARAAKTGRGQVQKWFLLRVDDDVSPRLPMTEPAEFSNFEWVDFDEAIARVVGFKRPIYEAVADAFRPWLGSATLSEAGREYVLAEFAHVTGSYVSNEEMGERRVVNFVTFIALLATAIGLVSESLPQAGAVETLWLAFAGAVAALAIGLLTFRRVLKRNVETTRLLLNAYRLRRTLTIGDPIAQRAIPFGRPKPREFHWRNGGLAETVAVVNSLLVAAAVTLVATDRQVAGAITATLAAIGFVVAAVVHGRLAQRHYHKELSSDNEG